MPNLIETIIEKYQDERYPKKLSLSEKDSLSYDLSNHIEQDGKYLVFHRKGFDLSCEYNFQSYTGFHNNDIAFISVEDLYEYLFDILLKENQLVPYLNGFDLWWLDELLDNSYDKEFVAHIDNEKITFEHIRKSTITKKDLLEEMKSETLLDSIIRFLGEPYVHFKGSYYYNPNYVAKYVEDPRQLKLFPAGSIPNCS